MQNFCQLENFSNDCSGFDSEHPSDVCPDRNFSLHGIRQNRYCSVYDLREYRNNRVGVFGYSSVRQRAIGLDMDIRGRNYAGDDRLDLSAGRFPSYRVSNMGLDQRTLRETNDDS